MADDGRPIPREHQDELKPKATFGGCRSSALPCSSHVYRLSSTPTATSARGPPSLLALTLSLPPPRDPPRELKEVGEASIFLPWGLLRNPSPYGLPSGLWACWDALLGDEWVSPQFWGEKQSVLLLGGAARRLLHPRRGPAGEALRSHWSWFLSIPFPFGLQISLFRQSPFQTMCTGLLKVHSLPSFMPQLFWAGYGVQRQRRQSLPSRSSW